MKLAFKIPSLRNTYWLGLLFCLTLIAIALYLQSSQGLVPCPLCIAQRLSIALLGLWFLIAGLHPPQAKWRRYHSLLLCLTAAFGLLAAGRQLWLEHLPLGTAPACGPGLAYLLENLPLHQVVLQVFQGSGECAEVTWRFLSLSIPAWTFIFLSFLLILSFWQGIRK